MPELNLDNTDERRRHLDIPLMKLDEKYTLTILYVLRNGPIQKTDLTNIVASSSDTVKKRVDHLVEEGLVQEVRENQRPFRKMVRLTEKGKRISCWVV